MKTNQRTLGEITAQLHVLDKRRTATRWKSVPCLSRRGSDWLPRARSFTDWLQLCRTQAAALPITDDGDFTVAKSAALDVLDVLEAI